MQGWEFKGSVRLIIPADDEDDAKVVAMNVWQLIRDAVRSMPQSILAADVKLNEKPSADVAIAEACVKSITQQLRLFEKGPDPKTIVRHAAASS